MKTKLRKAEKRVIAVKCAVIAAAVALTVYGFLEILDGSLVAVLYTPVVAAIACKTGEDVQRIVEETKRRDGNGTR